MGYILGILFLPIFTNIAGKK